MKIEGNQKELDAMVEFHKGNRVEGLNLSIFLKSHVELLFHLPRYALLILTSISIFY